MGSIRDFLDGKKSYIAAGLTILDGILMGLGVNIPPFIFPTLAGLFGLTLRAALSKQTAELITAVKESK